MYHASYRGIGMHLPNTSAWPVVRPLPNLVVKIVLLAGFIAGHIVLFNDRRMIRKTMTVQKTTKLRTPASV